MVLQLLFPSQVGNKGTMVNDFNKDPIFLIYQYFAVFLTTSWYIKY